MYKIHVPSLPTLDTFETFNQSCGCNLDSNHELVALMDMIPWREFEPEYAKNFSNATRGKGARPLQMALGSLILQVRSGLSDRAFIKALKENPYWQYFIGMKKFDKKVPFGATSLVYFRKRLSFGLINSINETLLKMLEKDKNISTKKNNMCKNNEDNIGTSILDATCAPSYIAYPKDTSLLNQCKTKLEKIIDYLYEQSSLRKKPRTYRRIMHKEYLSFAKKKKVTTEQVRDMQKKLLSCVKRDLKYVDSLLAMGLNMTKSQTDYYERILLIYAQQKEMYENRSRRVDDRIVSLDQPYLRPIVRGKSGTPVEFGAKLDVSLDENGHARIEFASFDPYNESEVLIATLERYKERNGHYPERILVDQIYRNRKNIDFCNEKGIRISGPKLGRPSKLDKEKNKENIQIEKQDKKDRIAIERLFSKAKRCCGMAVIRTRLADTTLTTIAMSVFITNLFAVPIGNFFVFYFTDSGIFDLEPITFAEFYDS